jgi:ribosomal protein S26
MSNQSTTFFHRCLNRSTGIGKHVIRLVKRAVVPIAVIGTTALLAKFAGEMYTRRHNKALLQDVSTIEDFVEEEADLPARSPLTRFQREVLQAVKCRHGVPKDSEVNREVVRRAIVAEIMSDQDRARTFRRVDMVKHVTLMMVCVFSPTQYEIDISRLEHDKFYTTYLYHIYRLLSSAIGRPVPLTPMERKALYIRAAV